MIHFLANMRNIENPLHEIVELRYVKVIKITKIYIINDENMRIDAT